MSGVLRLSIPKEIAAFAQKCDAATPAQQQMKVAWSDEQAVTDALMDGRQYYAVDQDDEMVCGLSISPPASQLPLHTWLVRFLGKFSAVPRAALPVPMCRIMSGADREPLFAHMNAKHALSVYTRTIDDELDMEIPADVQVHNLAPEWVRDLWVQFLREHAEQELAWFGRPYDVSEAAIQAQTEATMGASRWWFTIGREAIACAEALPGGTYSFDGMYVTPGSRYRLRGALLAEAMVAHAHQQGRVNLSATVAPWNDASAATLARVGMVPNGNRIYLVR